jgi:hypothetical protein
MKRKSLNVSLILVVVIASSLSAVMSCKKETKVSLPVLTTNPVTDITSISAICGGTVSSEGGQSTWIRGICWSTKPTPTIDPSLNFDAASAATENYNGVTGTGSFTFPLTGLLPLTKYYVRAFAQNSAGVGYGDDFSFSTPALVIGAAVLDGIAFDIDTSGLHGLACAPMDEGTLSWSNGSYVNTAAIDGENGYQNTNLIYIAQGGNAATYAAISCTNHIGGVYSNSYSVIWYLPSKNELSKLFAGKDAIGNLADGAYWSSTEFDLKNAWIKDFTTGKETILDKATTHHVRAIRAF